MGEKRFNATERAPCHYRYVQVCPSINEHVHQRLVPCWTGVHQWSHALNTHTERVKHKKTWSQVYGFPTWKKKFSLYAFTWSSIVFTPSGPRSWIAWPIRSVRPELSMRKPRSRLNLSVAAFESRRLKEVKQHSGLRKRRRESEFGANYIKRVWVKKKITDREPKYKVNWVKTDNWTCLLWYVGIKPFTSILPALCSYI